MSLIFLLTLFFKSHKDLHIWSYPVKPMDWVQPCPLRAQVSLHRPFCSGLQASAAFGQANQAVNWDFILFDSQRFHSFLPHSHSVQSYLFFITKMQLLRGWHLSPLSGLSAGLEKFSVTRLHTTSQHTTSQLGHYTTT